MHALRAFLLSTLVACAVEAEMDDMHDDADPAMPPSVDVSTPTVEDVQCDDAPVLGAATGFRHTGSSIIASVGDAHHRGVDLIATSADPVQSLRGKLTYGDLDKDLEDEDVELLACVDGAWRALGTARSDSDGRFELSLSGNARLPVGLRDMWLSVSGDRSGGRFLALVAPPDAPVVVSDVDGTLTASENAYPTALAIGGDTPVQPGAPAALMSAAMRGVNVVYITARGDRFTHDTREWFAANGFPRGPVRMPESIVTIPGEDTVEFKTAALAELDGFTLVAGIGNRASDIAAYTNARLSPERILIKLPEFTDEVEPSLAAGDASGFDHYDTLRIEP